MYVYDANGSPVGMVYRNSTMAADATEEYLFVKKHTGRYTARVQQRGQETCKLRVRNTPIQLQKTFLPTKFQIKNNENNSIRKLIKPQTFDLDTNVEAVTLSMMVAVKFQLSDINMFTKLDTLNSMETLIGNSRSAPNNLKLMDNMTSIVRNIPIYSLKYYDNQYAVDCLLSVLE